MSTFYRFRSVERVLGDRFQKLENESIFFASPKQPNDAMEWYRDFFRSGDLDSLFEVSVRLVGYLTLSNLAVRRVDPTARNKNFVKRNIGHIEVMNLLPPMTT
jgi:hypothetical protein